MADPRIGFNGVENMAEIPAWKYNYNINIFFKIKFQNTCQVLK